MTSNNKSKNNKLYNIYYLEVNYQGLSKYIIYAFELAFLINKNTFIL